jgi:hypothetical protein
MARKPKHHRRKHWPAHRIPVQRPVMALEVYPHWRTIPELAREVGPSGALTRAVIELVGLGLLESYGSAVRPTNAIAHMERLRLP